VSRNPSSGAIAARHYRSPQPVKNRLLQHNRCSLAIGARVGYRPDLPPYRPFPDSNLSVDEIAEISGSAKRRALSHIRALSDRSEVCSEASLARAGTHNPIVRLLAIASACQRTAAGRRSQGLSLGQPCKHVDSRGGRLFDRGNWHERLQQFGFSTSKMFRKTVWHPSCQNSPVNGPGTMKGRY
jgi:hypothetical protein